MLDTLLDKGYSLYKFSQNEGIFHGLQGIFLRGEHKYKGISSPCTIYVPELPMDCQAIHAVKTAFAENPESVYAIERNYVSFTRNGSVEALEEKILNARRNRKILFPHLTGTKTKKIAWATDIHLNFLETDSLERFFKHIISSNVDALLLTGDIAEAKDFTYYLNLLEQRIQKPVYFVLGNHDFYGSSIEKVHKKCADLCESSHYLCWLTQTDVAHLTPELGLVGHDGWADGQHGDFLGSNIVMNDYVLIQDLVIPNTKRDFSKREYKHALLDKMIQIAGKVADHIKAVLPESLKKYKHTILLTHIPPFINSAVYDGKTSTEDWLPHMSSHIVASRAPHATVSATSRGTVWWI